MKRAWLLFLLVFVLFPATAVGQAQTGTPPFDSLGGGPDRIDLGNLNSHLTIPVIHKPGRGLNLVFDITYDSAVWYPVGASGSQSWTPVTNWGWQGNSGIVSPYVGYLKVITKICFDNGILGGETGEEDNYFWRYVDQAAVGTAFGSTEGGWGKCGGQLVPQTSLNVTATNGTGYSFSATGSTFISLKDNKGAAINAPVNTQVPLTGPMRTDRNGNEISYNNGIIDTLGVTMLTESGVAPNPVVFSYPAPGGTAKVTVNYTSYTVATNFGVSGIKEFGATAESLVSSIVLSDGTQYTFNYEPTPSAPSSGACTPKSGTFSSYCVTARLASIGLPTGGTIQYTYSGGNNGVLSDGTVATLMRQTPDGTWTYTRSLGTSPASTEIVTDPAGNDTVIQFQGIYETQRQAYLGSHTSGTLLQTTNTCYNGATSPCTGTAVSAPITGRTVTIQLAGPRNLECEHVYSYNTNGSLTGQSDFDYGSGTIGPELKATVITYASLGTITGLRNVVTVFDGSHNIISQTKYNYDETAVVNSTGTPQHASVSGSRGNLTSINYYTHGSTFIAKRMTYYDTGMLASSTDVNGNAQTTYNYSDATSTCGNTFPTSITEPLNMSRSMTWNCTGGVQTSLKDENGQTSGATASMSYTQDLDYWRPESITDPTGALATLTYPERTQSESTMNFNGTGSTMDVLITKDSLGRPSLAQKKQSPTSTNYDSVETDYDSLGRVSRVTLPYVGTKAQTNPTGPAVTTGYDPLGRVTSISDNSGGSRTFSFSQNDVFITRLPAPTGENAKRRQEEKDALGRITSVCEITAGTSGAPAGTCAQNTSQTGYWTKYTYDALGRLTGVSQNAQSSNPQSRTYTYDLMGRLTQEVNPETGTTSYVYDTDATCGTSNGDLMKKTDALGDVICYSYDQLHRITAITYPSGQYASVTPSKHFVYDSATVNSVAMANAKTHLAEAYTCTGSCTTKLTDEGFSYTARGETSDVYQSTPNSSGYYHVNALYWSNSAPEQLSGLTGVPTITFTPDGEGRPYKVSASSGQNPVTNTVFSAASLPTSVTYGSGDADSYVFDLNTNRPTKYTFSVNSQSLTGTLTWNPNHTLQSQVIVDPFNSSDAQSCSYTHDDLTRLASVSCGSIFSQTFTYDAFGNLSKSGTFNFQPTYKDGSGNTTNRFVSIPGTTVTYDANGNDLGDGSHTYSMDAAGHDITVDSVSLTYDALGRMVEQNRSGAHTQIIYGPRGGKLALFSGQTLQKAFVPLPGGGVAVYNSSGLLYYGHSDHMGSIKLASTPSRTVLFDLAYAPFGEQYATSGSTDPAFTGQRQDTVGSLYDFPARHYSTQGRWPAPDPSGMASVSLSDPQTFNRYAYTRNNPLAMVDPTGLDGVVCVLLECCDDSGCWDSEDDGAGDGGSGGGGGDGGDVGCAEDPTCSGDPSDGGDINNAGIDCSPDDSTCGDNTGNCADSNTCSNGDQQNGPSGPVCQDTNGNPSACLSGPPAPDQNYPINCSSNCAAYGDPMLQIAEGVSQDVTYGDIFTVYGGSVATGAMVWGILEGGSELAGSSWLAYNADQFLIGIADASGQGAGPGTFAGDPSLGYLLGYFVGSLSWWIQGPGSGGGIPP